VNQDLARLLANCPDSQVRDPKEAIRLARRGIDLVPEDGHIWQALGMAYYRAGEWTNAVAALDRAMALRGGGDAPDQFFMAMAQWRLSHCDQARSRYNRAIQQLEGRTSRPGLSTGDPEIDNLRAEAADLLGLGVPRAPKDPEVFSRPGIEGAAARSGGAKASGR
jgi:tetratricopeptide (TPR) repeat protein